MIFGKLTLHSSLCRLFHYVLSSNLLNFQINYFAFKELTHFLSVLLFTVLLQLAFASRHSFEPTENRFGLCENEDHAVFDYPNNTNRYILCLFQRELIVLCPDNKIFNKAKDTCETPAETTTVGTTTVPQTTENWENICKNDFFEFHAIKGTCKQFVGCILQVAFLGNCDPGKIFVGTDCVRGDEETCVPY